MLPLTLKYPPFFNIVWLLENKHVRRVLLTLVILENLLFFVFLQIINKC
jgi:hypothetical protein